MNIVFGHLVGDFNGYFVPHTTVTEAMFKSSVNKNAYAPGSEILLQLVDEYNRLYLVYLFIGKFVLTYISMVCAIEPSLSSATAK